MIKTESFPALFLVLYCPIAIIVLTLLFLLGGAEFFKPALLGSAVSVLLIWSTVLVTDKLLQLSTTGLLLIAFGGIIFRFTVVIGSGLVVKFVTNMNLVSFFSGLLLSYIMMQLIEIIYFQKRFGKQKPENK